MKLEDLYRIARQHYELELTGGGRISAAKAKEISSAYAAAVKQVPVLVGLAIVALARHKNLQVDPSVLAEDLPSAEIF